MTPNPQRQAFLDMIIAEPHEDVHRLVYADWIDERGESERGELIRVQIRLAEYDQLRVQDFSMPPLEWLELKQRERLLLAHFFLTNSWVLGTAKLHRGFVSELECTWPDWNAHADEITRQHPIEEVKLLTMPELDHNVIDGEDWMIWRLQGRSETYNARKLGGTSRTIKEQIINLIWPTIKFTLPEPTP